MRLTVGKKRVYFFLYLASVIVGLSLLGGSVLISNDKFKICATLSGYEKISSARFSAEVGGIVLFRGSSNTNKISIYSDLYTFVETVTKNENKKWKLFDGTVNEKDLSKRCNNIGKVYNPNGKTASGCSTTKPSGCLPGDLSGKHGDLLIGYDIGKAKKAATDDSLSLTGANTIVGKTLAILDNSENVIACARINNVMVKKAEMSVNQGGIKFSIKFQQTYPLAPTRLWFTYTSGGKFSEVQILERPILPRISKDDDVCSKTNLGSVFNPFTINTAAQSGTPDLIPVGNLFKVFNSKFTDLPTTKTFDVYNNKLQLFGQNSVIGRATKIVSDTNKVGCSNIVGEDSLVLTTAVVTLKYPLIGYIIFQQDANDPSADTTVFVDLNRLDNTATKGHKWHVHVNKISTDFVAKTGRCLSSAGHYNPYTVPLTSKYASDCSPTKQLRCEVGDLSGKHGKINIGSKYFFTDVQLPLSGDLSIIGKSVVVHDTDGSRLACADIIQQTVPKVVANQWSTSSGPSGKITFQQRSLYDFTRIEVGLNNLKKEAGGYHVHLYNVPKGVENPCSASNVKGHFDPFGPTTAPSSPGSLDQYEVGDLSGKFGSLSGMSSISKVYKDPTLCLSGQQSVVGRSIVIHKQNGDRWSCADIVFEQPNVISAVATFTDDMNGYIRLTQYVDYSTGYTSNTAVEIELKHSSDAKKVTKNHNWHVHSSATGGGTSITDRCISPHYNPYLADTISPNYKTSCNPSNPLACELGDQAGKLGKYSVGGGKALFTDVDLPLSGQFSVIGRSFVVHSDDSGSSRIACADILPVTADKISLLSTDSKNKKADLRDTVTNMMNLSPWEVVVSQSRDCGSPSFIVYFTGPSSAENLKSFNKLVQSKDKRLENLTLVATCRGCVSQIHTLCMVLVLSLWLLVQD